MKKFTYALVLIFLASSSILLYFYIINIKSLKLASSELVYYQNLSEKLIERSIKQHRTLGAIISFEQVLDSKELKPYSFTGSSTLMLVFPESACGICYDVVMQSIKDYLVEKPSDNIYVITDLKSLNDVSLYLKDYDVVQRSELLVRKTVFDLPAEGIGYPYLINARVDQINNQLVVNSCLIPDKSDDTITRAFLFNSLMLN